MVNMIEIIIPAFNCEKTILNTIESIKKSGINDYEILIVDDGSTDNTAAICDGLSASNNNIRCIHQKNAGASAARNTGLKNADGEYVFFFDSDDSVIPSSLENAEKIINAYHPDMLIFGMNFDYYHKGKLYRRDAMVYPNEGMTTLDDVKKNFQELYDCNALTSTCNKIFKKSILMQNDLVFDNSMVIMEDFLFVLNTLPFCNEVYCLPEAAYCYKQSEDEKNAYNRLKRVDNLPELTYMFESALKKIEISDYQSFIRDFYQMLLYQKMYYSSYTEIRSCLNRHFAGRYKDVQIQASPMRILIFNKKVQLRHRIAVSIKSMLSQHKEQSVL